MYSWRSLLNAQVGVAAVQAAVEVKTVPLVLIDAVSRFIPGVLGTKESATDESIYSGLLECDQYTKPREYAGMTVPEVLFNGNHKLIHLWQYENALTLTRDRRPDLLEKWLQEEKKLTRDEKKILDKIMSGEQLP